MGLRQRIWAAKARDALMEELGGECVACGTKENLTFDCKDPQGDSHHRMEWSARISFYRGQHKKKNLQILCKEHNTWKSHADRKILDDRLQNTVENPPVAGGGSAGGAAESDPF